MNYGEPKLICPLIAAELFHARGTCERVDRRAGCEKYCRYQKQFR